LVRLRPIEILISNIDIFRFYTGGVLDYLNIKTTRTIYASHLFSR
jgi:hypothetical protein